MERLTQLGWLLLCLVCLKVGSVPAGLHNRAMIFLAVIAVRRGEIKQ